MIKVIFECGGCDATAEGRLWRKFRSFSGRSYGFGTYHTTTPQEAAPEGWIAFDPYTQVTYCPDCWADIGATPMSDRNPCPKCESTNLDSARNPMTRECYVVCRDCGRKGPIGDYGSYVRLWNEQIKDNTDD